jgi:hypothetical protein
MTKLPAHKPTTSMLLAVLSLGILAMPSRRAVRIALSMPARQARPSRGMANRQRGG